MIRAFLLLGLFASVASGQIRTSGGSGSGSITTTNSAVDGYYLATDGAVFFWSPVTASATNVPSYYLSNNHAVAVSLLSNVTLGTIFTVTTTNIQTAGGDSKGRYSVDLQMDRASDAADIAKGQYTFVAGGRGNRAEALMSAVVGGIGNRAMGLSTSNSGVFAGSGNTVSNTFATIVGGEGNYNFGYGSFVAGGTDNHLGFYPDFGWPLPAIGAVQYNVILGGERNVLSNLTSSAIIASADTIMMGNANDLQVLNGVYSSDSALNLFNHGAIMIGGHDSVSQFGTNTISIGSQNFVSGYKTIAIGNRVTNETAYAVKIGFGTRPITVSSNGVLTTVSNIVTSGSISASGDLTVAGGGTFNGNLSILGEIETSNLSLPGHVADSLLAIAADGRLTNVTMGTGVAYDTATHTLTGTGGGGPGSGGPFNINQFSASTTHTNIKDGAATTNLQSFNSFRVTGAITNRGTLATNPPALIMEEDGLQMIQLLGSVVGPGLYTSNDNIAIGFIGRGLIVENANNRVGWFGLPYGDLGYRELGGWRTVGGSNLFAIASITNLGVFYNGGGILNAGPLTNTGSIYQSLNQLAQLADITSQSIVSTGRISGFGRLLFNIDRGTNGQTAFAIGNTDGPDHSIVLSSNLTTAVSGTPLHGQRWSLTISNSAVTNIVVGIEPGKSIQRGALVTSWPVMATNQVVLRYVYSTNDTGGAWDITAVEREAVFYIKSGISTALIRLNTNGVGADVDLEALYLPQPASLPGTNLANGAAVAVGSVYASTNTDTATLTVTNGIGYIPQVAAGFGGALTNIAPLAVNSITYVDGGTTNVNIVHIAHGPAGRQWFPTIILSNLTTTARNISFGTVSNQWVNLQQYDGVAPPYVLTNKHTGWLTVSMQGSNTFYAFKQATNGF
jgi:hypothetical protein